MLGMSFVVPGDLQLTEDGTDLASWQGIDEIAQTIDAALHIFQGTWKFNLRAGLSDFRRLFDKPAATSLWRSEVYRTIASVEGVERVQSVVVSFDRPTRRLRVTWRAKTVAGAATSSVEYA